MELTKEDISLIEKEIKGCFDFFWNESNSNLGSKGYGLTVDITGKKKASIASVGFALPAYVIGVERNYITFEEGYERVLNTLKTIQNIDSFHGFLLHFVNQETGENDYKCEYSTIDTAIFLMGAIVAKEFFKGEISTLVNEFLESVDWDCLITEKNGKKVFKMAYSLDLYANNGGWNTATWDHYAEQLMMYILYAGKKGTDPKMARELYYGFTRHVGGYKGKNMVYCFGNSLFIHQFTHAFFDFSMYVDERGFDWFENSINATLANRQFCIDQKWSSTFHENSWGLTACETKNGYRVYGSPPHGFFNEDYKIKVEEFVAPYAALSSFVFTPKESLAALKYFNTIACHGKYGITDSYHLGEDPWFSEKYVGIDKGPTILMLDNYLSGTTWKYFMQSDVAKMAIEKLKFQKRDYSNYYYKKN